MSQIEEIGRHLCFGGEQLRFQHASEELGCEMRFSIFLPPQVRSGPRPVLYWLSGLTCTDENFVTKAGAQRAAARHGVIIVAPDTSPRGEGVPDDPEGAYDLGLGAGFYVDASQEPWAKHYRMASYISAELPALIEANFPVDTARCGVFGHSMGGHGAISLGLKHPQLFRSISAFAPIASPTRCPWGQKALTAYLGSERSAWEDCDSSLLMAKGLCKTPVLVDQGEADTFLQAQLKPELLEAAAAHSGHPLTLRRQAGYDHSYFFMASFMDEHIAWHVQQLDAEAGGPGDTRVGLSA